MLAVHGVADYVVCYRAFNERSGRRFGAGVQDRPPAATAEQAHFAWYAPFGLLTPAQWVAMFGTRYMHEYGATSEDFKRVAVADRKHAATNPKAWFYEKPITLEEHQQSRWIVEPLHLLDCCQESDGAQAIVVTSVERARPLASGRDHQLGGAGRGENQDMMTSYYRDSITGSPEMGLVARQLWNTTGLGPDDIQTAVIYDHFTPLVLPQLEEFGFCAQGEAKEFLRDGNVELGGRLPINTHGGQLGEAYIHGMNGIAEGVRQVRGTSVNQVTASSTCSVTPARASRRAPRPRFRQLTDPKVTDAGSEWETQNEQQGTCDGVGQWPVVRRLAVHDRVRAPALLADRARRGHLAVLRRRCRGAVGTRAWKVPPCGEG